QGTRRTGRGRQGVRPQKPGPRGGDSGGRGLHAGAAVHERQGLSRQAAVSSLQPGPESPASPNAAASDPADRSLADDLRRLSEDARALARAELAYQKSRAAFAGQEAKRIALLGLLAGVLTFFALMALTLGLVLALTPLLTA